VVCNFSCFYVFKVRNQISGKIKGGVDLLKAFTSQHGFYLNFLNNRKNAPLVQILIFRVDADRQSFVMNIYERRSCPQQKIPAPKTFLIIFSAINFILVREI